MFAEGEGAGADGGGTKKYKRQSLPKRDGKQEDALCWQSGATAERAESHFPEERGLSLCLGIFYSENKWSKFQVYFCVLQVLKIIRNQTPEATYLTRQFQKALHLK